MSDNKEIQLAVAHARLEEKYNNLESKIEDLRTREIEDLRARERSIQQDLIKKAEEIKEASNQNKNLEKELKRVNQEFRELEARVEEQVALIKNLREDKTIVYGKLIIYAIGGIVTLVGGLIGLLFSTGLIKF